MRKFLIMFVILFISAGSGIVGCALIAKPELQTPKVELERVEIAHYWPFFLEPKEKRGSPLDLAFVYNIHNPNGFTVMLDEFKFTVAFEPGFEVNTVFVYEDMYIPANTTNQLRVHAAFDAYTTLLSLLVTGGYRLQEMGVKAPDQLKSWWEKVQDFEYKIEVRNGTASFTSEYGNTIAAFEVIFPK